MHKTPETSSVDKVDDSKLGGPCLNEKNSACAVEQSTLPKGCHE